ARRRPLEPQRPLVRGRRGERRVEVDLRVARPAGLDRELGELLELLPRRRPGERRRLAVDLVGLLEEAELLAKPRRLEEELAPPGPLRLDLAVDLELLALPVARLEGERPVALE